MITVKLRLCSQIDLLKVSDVREEEADEGQSQRPFRDGADDVRCVTKFSRGPV